MYQAAERIPGLETASGGEGDERVLVIGWDRSAVFREANKIADQQRGKWKDAQKAKRLEGLREHQDFIKRLPNVPPKAEFSISRTEGEYMIDFKEITEGYPEDADDLGLRITNGGLGIIEGMINLDTDRHQLKMSRR